MTLIEPVTTTATTTSQEVGGYRNDDNVDGSEAAVVKRWLARIKSAEDKWKGKFEEMRKNMEFVAGWQWDGQEKLDAPQYINNVTLRMVNQKVASLYARNPKVEVQRRDRMNYQLWDGDMLSVMQAVGQVTMAQMQMQLPPIEALALLQDYEQGRTREKYVDRVCKTLGMLYQYQVDAHRPEFKEQMKQLVRRVIICKVGYVKLRMCSTAQEKAEVSTISNESDASERIARAQAILDELMTGKLDESAAEVAEAKQLLIAAGASAATDEAPTQEYLEFDCPPATSIIPSEECRSLKEFVAATFVAQKYTVTPLIVKSVFGVDMIAQPDCENKDGTSQTTSDEVQKDKKKVDIYEVFDITTKTRFFVGKGFKDYILPPEPVTPTVSGFWPIFALTFNDVESEEDTKSSPFPPSDVDLLRNPQKEWNRTRNALRDQRNANAPKYVVADGMINEDDIEALEEAKPNSVTKLKSLPPGAEPSKFIQPLQFQAIDPALYDTSPMEKDMLMAGGMQEANIGPAGKDVTATVGTIAEQSRMTMLASNVDDLDEFLTRLSKAGMEMIMRSMTLQTAQRIVGPGAVLPDGDVEEYLNEIMIKVQAASSGRPNKAMGIANAQQLAPLLLQAGANPVAIVEELVRRLDDTLDIDKFFPLTPPTMTSPSADRVSTVQPGAEKSAAGQRTISAGQNAPGMQQDNKPITAQG